VHVLDRAVSGSMSAMNLSARSDGHGGGTWTGPHLDSAGAHLGGVTEADRSKQRRLSTFARYSYQILPRRSLNA
jgi:hypothetical protein